jgi:hypothetical protein
VVYQWTDIERVLEIDPQMKVAVETKMRLSKEIHDRQEKMKEEMLGRNVFFSCLSCLFCLSVCLFFWLSATHRDANIISILSLAGIMTFCVVL